jgi:hypothetical protein
LQIVLLASEYDMRRAIMLFVVIAAGCAKSAPPPAVEETVVYFDTALKEAVLTPPASIFPAVNPKTGKRTLMPAAWCPGCKAWHAAPPIEEVQRNPKALLCPKTGAKLNPKGPEP